MRILAPQDLAAHIEREGIAAQLLPMTIETPTVAAAADALGVAAAQIVKSLLFLVRGEPVLVIAGGATLVDQRRLAGHYGVGRKQIKLADAGTVLQVTGYRVGGVAPFGHRCPVPVLMDRQITAWEVVYAGGGDDRTLLRIAVAELARATSGEWADVAKDQP